MSQYQPEEKQRIYYNPYVNAPKPHEWSPYAESSNQQIPFMEYGAEPQEPMTAYGAQPTHYYEPQYTKQLVGHSPTTPEYNPSFNGAQPTYYDQAPVAYTPEMNPAEEPGFGVHPTFYHETHVMHTPELHPTNETGYGVQPTYYTHQHPTHSTKDALKDPNLNEPNPKYLFTGPDISVPYKQTQTQGVTAYHIHEFQLTTETKDGHKHTVAGTTEPAPNNVPNHRHPYWAVTTYQDGHRHEMQGMSGPAIPLQGGGHVHLIEGSTFGYPNHQHHYEDKTEPSKL